MASPSRGGSTVASALVLVIVVVFALYSRHQRQGDVTDGVPMQARFLSANGLASGARVELAGVTVGQVKRITLDPKAQVAVVDFTIPDSLRLPADTVASIEAPTMTADNMLKLAPGKSTHILAPGSTITDTRDATSLEQEVSNYIFGGSLGGG